MATDVGEVVRTRAEALNKEINNGGNNSTEDRLLALAVLWGLLPQCALTCITEASCHSPRRQAVSFPLNR